MSIFNIEASRRTGDKIAAKTLSFVPCTSSARLLWLALRSNRRQLLTSARQSWSNRKVFCGHKVGMRQRQRPSITLVRIEQ
jgi:hypothetical protein